MCRISNLVPVWIEHEIGSAAVDSEVKITSERTYACHIGPHQIDIGVLHQSEGERVCWKANTEGDHPKVNPAEGLHVLCVCAGSSVVLF